jgi:menaquinone-dependent protoporphyrinogen oxidase
MSGKVLVTFASKRGSTREVAEVIANQLRAAGQKVDLWPADVVGPLDAYSAVIVGGALYMGRWHRDARRFLKRHRDELARMPVAVFAMGPATLEEKDVASSRKQLERALRKAPEVRPASVAIFGGVVDPAKLRFPFNRMPASDARDWDAIAAWTSDVSAAHVRTATLRV